MQNASKRSYSNKLRVAALGGGQPWIRHIIPNNISKVCIRNKISLIDYSAHRRKSLTLPFLLTLCVPLWGKGVPPLLPQVPIPVCIWPVLYKTIPPSTKRSAASPIWIVVSYVRCGTPWLSGSITHFIMRQTRTVQSHFTLVAFRTASITWVSFNTSLR